MGAAAGTHHQAPASGAPQVHISGSWEKVNQLKATVKDDASENSEEFEIVFEVI
jgi:hypothetical protein